MVRSSRLGLAVSFIAVSLVLSACGLASGSSAPPPPNVGISATSGTFTTTVRTSGVTTLPFSETVVVDILFEESIYGLAGQTSVFVEARPVAYRVGTRPRRSERIYTFSLTNRLPGTVEVSVYDRRDGTPVTFTLAIGVDG